MDIEILDLGINNLKSLSSALASLDVDSFRVIEDANESKKPKLLILPGVGAFGAAMARLRSRGFENLIQKHLESQGSLFGVCLGMQLLGNTSDESPGVRGLNLISGDSKKLPSSPSARVPNVGWLDITPTFNNFLESFSGNDFYFVHSYWFNADSKEDILLTAEHDLEKFPAAIMKDRVLGFQFHPEKSSYSGLKILGEVISWAND